MIRVEGICYKGLDQRFEMARRLEEMERKKEIKSVKDLGGGVMLIEHFGKRNRNERF